MSTYVLTLHIIVCLILILLVLLQSGKEGMGVIFGGGSGSLFGSAGAGGLLLRLTAITAAVFLLTSLGYNYLNKSKGIYNSSVMDTPLTVPTLNKNAVPDVEIEKQDTSTAKTSSAVPLEQK